MESMKISDMTTENCIAYICDQFGQIQGTGKEHEERMSVVRRLVSLCIPGETNSQADKE